MHIDSRIKAIFSGSGLALGLTLLVGAGGAQAGVVTSIPGGTVYSMPAINYFGPGPQTVAPGVTWSSTNAINQGGSVFGFNEGYGFGTNGFWDGSVGSSGGTMAGVNDSFDAWGVTDTMTFSFATPVSAVGGFLNYVPGGSTPTTIAVFDSTNTLIESFNLVFLTNGGTDQGQFLGFQEATNDISSFTLTDNYAAITDLTTASTATGTPEPSTLLSGAALIGLMGLIRRKRQA